MIFRSIRARLYLILILLVTILGLIFINSFASKKVGDLDRKYARVVELDNQISGILAKEANLGMEKDDLDILKNEYQEVNRSCTQCHVKKTELIDRRITLLLKVVRNHSLRVQVASEVRQYLNTLTNSVNYIHEHHVTTLKNLLRHNKLKDDSDLDGNILKKSAVHSASELDIIKQSVTLQRQLFELSGYFYALDTAKNPLQFQEDFTRKINEFFIATNIFEDYSLDAQDGLLAEELLDSGRTFQHLFTTLVDLEAKQRILRSNLEKNYIEMDLAVSQVEHLIHIKRDTLKNRIILLERGSYFFIVLLIFLIFLRSREIVGSLDGVVTETRKIQQDFSYRIADDQNAAIEFQVVFKALNTMAQNISKRISKLNEEIDIRTRTEQDLSEEKERLSVTLRSIGDGVITTDLEGRIVFLNKVAEELTGWSNNEAQGKLSPKVFNIINEKTGQKCVSPIQRVLELGRIVGLANHTALIAKDGSLRSIADSGAPIRDQESKIIGVVLVFRDVSREKKLTEEILKIKKLESIGVLAGGIAHDFNNILTAILGNIELVSYRIDGNDTKTASLLSDAQKATRRAAKLTQQLLTFAKGGTPLKEETTLPELITESAGFILHGSQVICDYNFPEDLLKVDVDSGQIGQVIQNIILNAKHAMPEGGTITIQCTNVKDAGMETHLSVDTGDYVRISIQDTGIGIPRELIDKIFDPYFTTKQKGSGLGLAICHSIINKHDGHLTVDSSYDNGTTFNIYLPALHSTSNSIKSAAKEPERGSAIKAARIMVMDDDEMLRNVADAQLTTLGHETFLVKDGIQAINRYQELQDQGTPVDLVIMDLTIPGGMGGQEAAQKLLQLHPEAKLIVASGYSNDPIMADYRQYGFCSAVPKPFDLTELSKAIETALT